MRTISVVASAYNEEDCVAELVTRVFRQFGSLPNYNLELIVVDDGSTDRTLSILRQLKASHHDLKIINLARNFGTDGGLLAGLSRASGDAIVLMSADLQDPPELIPDFIRVWESGYENVYMVVSERQGVNPIRRFNSRLFYWLLGKISEQPIPRNASDFRLVDRKVLSAVLQMSERELFLRAQFAWVGFKQIGLESVRPPRFAGASKASPMHVLELALRGIISQSYLPLRAFAGITMMLSMMFYFASVLLVLNWLYRGVPFDGFGTIVGLSVFAAAVNLTALSALLLYIGQIHRETKNRPRFVISEEDFS